MRQVLPILVSAALVTGCPSRPCPVETLRDPGLALAAHADMRAPARVLRAEASVDRRGADGRIRGTVRMFIERPDRVRFDAMTQFGPAAILTSDGEAFALTDLRDDRYLEGPTCPANIERLLGLRFDGAEVARLLFGESPRIEAESMDMVCHDGAYRLTLRAEDGSRQELDLEVRADDLEAPPERQRLHLTRSEVFEADGSRAWKVTYGDYRFVEDPTDEASPRRGVAMPFTVRFEDPRHDVDTLVRFTDVDLNVEPPPGAFSQRPRPGLLVEHVSCD